MLVNRSNLSQSFNYTHYLFFKKLQNRDQLFLYTDPGHNVFNGAHHDAQRAAADQQRSAGSSAEHQQHWVLSVPGRVVIIRGFQRDVVYLGWPIAHSYMNPNTGGGGELRGLSQWVLYSVRNYRPSFRVNKPKTLVLNDWIRAFWACFHENAGL
jgi:hypothetical protein